jgi:hypothetical protein
MRFRAMLRSKAALLLYTPKPTADKLVALPDWFERFRQKGIFN